MSKTASQAFSTTPTWSIRHEADSDASSIENLTKVVFGPGMFTRAAYALREGVEHELALSFVAELNGQIVGSVRLTTIMWGGKPALMLGPLGVLPYYKNLGIGKRLMETAVAEARAACSNGSPEVMMLVGDFAYYAPFGFKRIPADNISLPRAADPQRILVCELVESAAEHFKGPATRAG